MKIWNVTCGVAVKNSVVRAAIWIVLATASRAFAADAAMPVKAPPIAYAYDWTGFYIGGHFGWGVSTQPMNLSMAPGDALSEPYRASGMLGGLQAGYNYQLPNRVVLGVEAGVTFADTFGKRSFTDTNFGGGQFISNLQSFGTARGRLGYALGSGWGWMMPYITGGLAWGENKAEVDFADGTVQTKSLAHLGWTAGAGVEFPIGDHWTAKAEYQYVDLGAKTYNNLSLDEMRPTASSNLAPQIHAFMLGLNYRPFANPPPKDQWPGADWDNWSIHGQATFVEQGYRSFNSPYQGENSLSGASQMRNTVSSTAFIGRRLWEGGEVYFDPEVTQGFGLSDTEGAAGYPNGEAQKSDFPIPHPNVARMFLRQTFGFGGAQEDVEDSANQVAGKRDISRLTLTIGKISVTDIFDDNAYVHDPRTTFMNWSIWEAGAFDYAADQVGYTWGAVAELNQKDWAARGGYFLEPSVSNVNTFDTRAGHGSYVGEVERRYSLFSQPGKLRVLGFVNVVNAGSYSDTLADPALDLDIAQTRNTRTKYGFVVNVEQAVNDNLGVFSRASWNDGHNEIMAFTDIDRSISVGAVAKGAAWGRPDDKIGVAGVVNALSGPHRDFIAAGGLGVLIGDGQLNYRPERVLEAYYAIALAKWATLTLDYQYLVNPAYNADRGPVSIYATRLHAEF
jgi:high affinity Mn2+ porin